MSDDRTPWLPSVATSLAATSIAYNVHEAGASLWACLTLWLTVVAAMKTVMGVDHP